MAGLNPAIRASRDPASPHGTAAISITRTSCRDLRSIFPSEAYVLCSIAADLHITQAVDQTKGVHATIAKSLFR